MLVLVERDPGPIDLPAALDFLRGCETVALRRPDVSGKLAGIADTITGASTAVPAGGHLDPTTVERATLAMIRHVLPDRQQFGGNDEAVARAVADHLAPGEWLRFAGAGNSPGRPGGSGVVMVTDEQLRLVQLRPRRGLRFGVQTAEATSRPLRPQTTLRATPRRSFFRDLVDVHAEAPGSEPLPCSACSRGRPRSCWRWRHRRAGAPRGEPLPTAPRTGIVGAPQLPSGPEGVDARR